MANCLANLNGISPTPFLKVKKSPKAENTWRTLALVSLGRNETEQESQEHLGQFSSPIQSTRRVLLGLATATLSLQFGNQKTLAEDNGYWLTGLIPIPPVVNKIANEETGTRSFLKKGIFVSNAGPKGSAYRLKKYAFDLTALGDLLGQDAWPYVRKYLRQRSSVMYYDFDTVITAAPVNDKEALTDLAKRLFDCVEKLEAAVKLHNVSETESYYQDTTTILQEVMDRVA